MHVLGTSGINNNCLGDIPDADDPAEYDCTSNAGTIATFHGLEATDKSNRGVVEWTYPNTTL